MPPSTFPPPLDELDLTTVMIISYLLFSPIIYLFTPSNARSLQSVLFALQAPVLYDQDIAQEKGASASFVSHVPRGDGVRGGSIVRDCQSYA
jgi:hypothetical protein